MFDQHIRFVCIPSFRPGSWVVPRPFCRHGSFEASRGHLDRPGRMFPQIVGADGLESWRRSTFDGLVQATIEASAAQPC